MVFKTITQTFFTFKVTLVRLTINSQNGSQKFVGSLYLGYKLSLFKMNLLIVKTLYTGEVLQNRLIVVSSLPLNMK